MPADEKEDNLNPLKVLLMSIMALLLISSVGYAGDYGWMRDFNIRAEADPSGLRARLEGRFQVGGINIEAALDSVDQPADAYMLLRLGEMSNQPIAHVIEKYKAKRGKGWGSLAKSLGIKPGSEDFQALKKSQDLYDDMHNGKKKSKSKGKGKGKK